MIVVEPYNSRWPEQFEAIKSVVWPLVQDAAVAIEHVGSTSVPGLEAKPIIDVDIVVDDANELLVVINRLRSVGYEHRGDLGIEGREAFRSPDNSIPQNLYVCMAKGPALKNHLFLRDHLRSDAMARKRYGELKRRLAGENPDSIDAYIEGKTPFIVEILALSGIESGKLELIKQANRAPGTSSR